MTRTLLVSGMLLVWWSASASPEPGAAPALAPTNVSIGKNLQSFATVRLGQPAPAGNMKITLTSSDPAKLLIAETPDAAGQASITLNVRERFRESPEFWLQALGDAGDVSYTASAKGYETGTGTVTLTPSGIVFSGPFGDGAAPEFVTTPGGWATKIAVRTMRLDTSLRHVEPQYVRGGLSVDVAFHLSNSKVGAVTPASLRISAAESTAVTQFKPARTGTTALTLKASPAFHTPAVLSSIVANVRTPGIAVADDMIIGENLQLPAALSLGEPAPPTGVNVTLTSSDPSRLLLSASPTEVGKPSIDVYMPAGSVTSTYYLQALSASGSVTHTASASGFAERTGTLALAPSGVIISLQSHGPPDKAEVFRPETAGARRRPFVALLSEVEIPLVVYTAYLDPATRRSADITVQPLRAGLTLRIDVRNENPAVGAVEVQPLIRGGDERGLFAFRPSSVGETVLSVVPPSGFTEPSNSTELLAIVRK